MSEKRDCSCLGTCRGAKGLGPRYRCALSEESLAAARANLRPVAAKNASKMSPLMMERDELRARVTALEGTVATLRDVIDCGTNALKDSILASGNNSRTNLHWVNKMRRDAGLNPKETA